MRWTQHNEERRSAIVAGAIALISESPEPSTISIHEIALKAGVADSVIYRQFQDRESLNKCIRTEISDRVHRDVDAALRVPERRSPMAIIRELVEVLLTWESTHSNLIAFLRSGPTSAVHANDGMYWLRTQLAERSADTATTLAAIVGLPGIRGTATTIHGAAAMAEGALRHWIQTPEPGLSREELITQITGYIWGMLDQLAKTHDVHIDPQQRLDITLQALSGSVRVPQPRPTS